MSMFFDGTHIKPSARVRSKINMGAPSRLSNTYSGTLEIGLVNNMPDAALLSTERQFQGLIEAASSGRIKLKLFHLPDVPRGEEARGILKQRYHTIDELYRKPVDALIVTGNEPRAKRLDMEPYWPAMTTLIDWAKDNTISTVWSCLAAHAAVLHLDKIERYPLAVKRSGVYTCAVNGQSEALASLPAQLFVCHSRMNEVRGDDLCAHGYNIISESAGGHIDVFGKSFHSKFLFLQGHPEYDKDSLMREYRRDVGRYLDGQRDIYPALPENYFDAETLQRMELFQQRAVTNRDRALYAEFPETELRQGLARKLKASADTIYRNWLAATEMAAAGLTSRS